MPRTHLQINDGDTEDVFRDLGVFGVNVDGITAEDITGTDRSNALASSLHFAAVLLTAALPILV